jgi:hypothetical protein
VPLCHPDDVNAGDDPISAIADLASIGGVAPGAAGARLIRAWLRRNETRNLLGALAEGLRESRALEAGRADRDALSRLIAGQIADWEFLAALKRFTERGEFRALDDVRSHLEARLPELAAGAKREEIVNEVISILRTRVGRSQRSPSAASDVQSELTRQSLERKIDEGVNEVSVKVDSLADRLKIDRERSPAAPVRLLTLEWAPEAAKKALTRLGVADPDSLARLERAAGAPIDPERLEQLVEESPAWLGDGKIELLRALAKLLEANGRWQLAADVWEEASYKVAGDQRADGLVRAAIAASMASDERRHEQLLERAEAISPEHPRLLLERISSDDDVQSQIETLSRVRTDDPELSALVSLQRAVTQLVEGDVKGAAESIKMAETASPGMAQTRSLRVSLAVYRGRCSITDDQPRSAPDLEEARRQALELRKEMIEQRRFEEASRLLMEAVDSSILVGEPEQARELVRLASLEELEAPRGAEVLAGAALRAGEPRRAAAMLDSGRETEELRRLRACAESQFGGSEQIERAVSTLEEIVEVGGRAAIQAAAYRALLAIDKPQLGWHEPSEKTLKAEGHERVAVSARAILLAHQGRFAAAQALLEHYSTRRWALEALLQVATLSRNPALRRATAERVLALGTDQGVELECGQAFAADGRLLASSGRHEDSEAAFTRATEILIRVAEDHSAPLQNRGAAYHLLCLVVGREFDDWRRVAELVAEWRKVLPRDSRLQSWQVPLAAQAA